MKIKESVIDFVQLAQEEQHLQFQNIWALEQLIFPTSTLEQLYSCLYDSTAVSIPIVQYFHRGKLVGQNIISILKLELNGQAIFIISSRAGFLTEYRGRSRSLNSAIRVALNYRMRNPFTPLWFVTTLMQPKIYTLFTSRSVNFFPRAGRKMPKAHADILNLMQSRHSGAEVRGENIIVHPCNMPKVTPEQLVRLRNRANSHNQFFLQHVPDYFDGKGLMCVCRLDFSTICETIFNLAADRKVK
jgi:hypothetical protein